MSKMGGAFGTPQGGVKTPIRRVVGCHGLFRFTYTCNACEAEMSFDDVCGPATMDCGCGHIMVRKINRTSKG